MFTGIIEETGVVQAVQPDAESIRFTVAAGDCCRGLKTGDSLAVNGCCLTVVRAGRARRRLIDFDLLRETWQRTNFRFLGPGASVNLERPLPGEGRFHGHFVTGHIDGVGEIVRWEQVRGDYLLEVKPPRALLPQMAAKGSVAVDGISLTLASVARQTFRVWIIPHTFRVTNLRERRLGDYLNLETDILAKYVQRLISISIPGPR